MNATAVSIEGCHIAGLGATTAAGTASPGFGILLDGTTSDVTVSGCDISRASQGVIAGSGVTHVALTGNRVHDIPGQHGVYLQNGTGLVIAGLDLADINLNGCKIQLSGTSAADSLGLSVAGVRASGCGDSALSLNNIAGGPVDGQALPRGVDHRPRRRQLSSGPLPWFDPQRRGRRRQRGQQHH